VILVHHNHNIDFPPVPPSLFLLNFRMDLRPFLLRGRWGGELWKIRSQRRPFQRYLSLGVYQRPLGLRLASVAAARQYSKMAPSVEVRKDAREGYVDQYNFTFEKLTLGRYTTAFAFFEALWEVFDNPLSYPTSSNTTSVRSPGMLCQCRLRPSKYHRGHCAREKGTA
jgi:hypothetical protein